MVKLKKDRIEIIMNANLLYVAFINYRRRSLSGCRTINDSAVWKGTCLSASENVHGCATESTSGCGGWCESRVASVSESRNGSRNQSWSCSKSKGHN